MAKNAWGQTVAPIDPYWAPPPSTGYPVPEPVGSTGAAWQPLNPNGPQRPPGTGMYEPPKPIEPQAPTTIGGRWGGAWDWDGTGRTQQQGRVGGGGTFYGQRGGGAQAFQGADEFSRLAWQSDPGMAYQRFVSQEATPGSHYERWLQQQQSQQIANYVDASRADVGMFVGDYLQRVQADLARRYAGMPSWQQGTNGPGPWFSGRKMG